MFTEGCTKEKVNNLEKGILPKLFRIGYVKRKLAFAESN